MMHTKLSPMTSLLLFIFLSSLTVGSTGENPFTPKTYLIRYWNKEIQNNHAKPIFLLSKASPLSATESASFSKLAAQNALSSQLSAFCASANLLCFPDSLPSTFVNAVQKMTGFGGYGPQTNYGGSANTKGGSGQKDGVFLPKEPGIFFRESMLKKGKVMPMPDINDKLPERSFLPRSISSKQPFSTLKVSELKNFFHAGDNSTMETIIVKSLSECKGAPNPGETKRCVSSAEDMIDFAVSVLGRNIDILTTKNVNRSKQNIMIGSIERINGGKVRDSVTCHQSLFPYLLYYCHSVSKVRVYQVDILDPNFKAKINNGVAICHMNTSDWSPTHEAFLALGSAPGRIEVCHWIFQNDLTWTVVD
ncbi:polygalacturonase non-catalytic subunit AroGP3-like [Quercus robur]|uniref:polygalacturonase non-catalytic subunit AroGP3-like n=1 Tax=Quercus robur TaxID=38942 RepID=UPI002163D727|nr:polygalacturonase non-catalytic subunit AroGP3-like [Quercus robur]XP_050262133.1 polygalacturonase non-catalytic subunit AroGP3-like [Quercus robur]